MIAIVFNNLRYCTAIGSAEVRAREISLVSGIFQQFHHKRR